MKLCDAINELIQIKGLKVLISPQFVNMLADLNAFDEMPSVKYFLKFCITENFMPKLCELLKEKKKNEIEKYIYRISAMGGFKEDVAYSLLYSLETAFGVSTSNFNNVFPKYNKQVELGKLNDNHLLFMTVTMSGCISEFSLNLIKHIEGENSLWCKLTDNKKAKLYFDYLINRFEINKALSSSNYEIAAKLRDSIEECSSHINQKDKSILLKLSEQEGVNRHFEKGESNNYFTLYNYKFAGIPTSEITLVGNEQNNIEAIIVNFRERNSSLYQELEEKFSYKYGAPNIVTKDQVDDDGEIYDKKDTWLLSNGRISLRKVENSINLVYEDKINSKGYIIDIEEL